MNKLRYWTLWCLILDDDTLLKKSKVKKFNTSYYLVLSIFPKFESVSLQREMLSENNSYKNKMLNYLNSYFFVDSVYITAKCQRCHLIQFDTIFCKNLFFILWKYQIKINNKYILYSESEAWWGGGYVSYPLPPPSLQFLSLRSSKGIGGKVWQTRCKRGKDKSRKN